MWQRELNSHVQSQSYVLCMCAYVRDFSSFLRQNWNSRLQSTEICLDAKR